MPVHQARLITACQQLLALGVVLAVLTPAAAVLTLDVVDRPTPTAPAAALVSADVATEEVEPEVDEYALVTSAGGNGEVPGSSEGTTTDEAPHGAAEGLGAEESEPSGDAPTQAVVNAPVEGYGAVGVTWDPESVVDEESFEVQVRTREGEEWGEWTLLEYHDDHMPDPDSPDAATARAGTDALIVGDVDEVQVQAVSEDGLPQDLSLAVVDPGEVETQQETPELVGPETAAAADESTEGEETDGLVLQAGKKRSAPQPTIFSRKQWGADERIRDKRSLRYGSISAGFVHHTVNANDYTSAQVPGIIRSIYAYHVKSRGWSDIGYNFLVDRFGRIWEGRAGGIDKAVVGAHTLGYNDYSFAMSAIGNFELVRPSKAMLDAYGDLFAWKLGLHGVNPKSKSQRVGRRNFPAINGHRDAGSTACPGRYLYAKLPAIRNAAAKAQSSGPTRTDWGTAQLHSDLVGSPHPDLVVRRASDGRGFILPTGGLSAFRPGKALAGKKWDRRRQVLVSPDLTGDGVADLVVVGRNGVLKVRPGNGKGGFGKVVRSFKKTKNLRHFVAAGDINGDGRNDLLALTDRRVAVAILTGQQYGLYRQKLQQRDWGRYEWLVGVGDLDGDGHDDLIGRTAKGVVLTRYGREGATYAAATRTPGNWARFDKIAGGVDLTGDGRTDLVVRRRNGKGAILPGKDGRGFGHPLGPVGDLGGLSDFSVASLDAQPGADLIGRRGGALVLRSNRSTHELGSPVDTGMNLRQVDLILNVGDWDRDGHGDLVTRRVNGNLQLRLGNGQGRFASPKRLGTGWGSMVDVAAVGDVDGDGYPDIVGRPPNGNMRLYRGQGTNKLKPWVEAAATPTPAARLARGTATKHDLSKYDWVISIADLQLGRRTDVVVRHAPTGRLFLINGTADGLKKRRFLGDGMGIYDLAG